MSDTPISKVNVEALVEKMLANSDINIKLLPDSIERKLYKNVIIGILSTMDEILSTMTLNVGGVQLKLDLVAADSTAPVVSNSELLSTLLESVSLNVAGHSLKASVVVNENLLE